MCWKSLLLMSQFTMSGQLSVLGTKWKTPFLSRASSSLPDLIWSLSLGTDAWPWRMALPCTVPPASSTWLSTQSQAPSLAPMIISYYVMTNQSFPTVTLKQWAASLKLTSGSLDVALQTPFVTSALFVLMDQWPMIPWGKWGPQIWGHPHYLMLTW